MSSLCARLPRYPLEGRYAIVSDSRPTAATVRVNMWSWEEMLSVLPGCRSKPFIAHQEFRTVNTSSVRPRGGSMEP